MHTNCIKYFILLVVDEKLTRIDVNSTNAHDYLYPSIAIIFSCIIAVNHDIFDCRVVGFFLRIGVSFIRTYTDNVLYLYLNNS